MSEEKKEQEQPQSEGKDGGKVVHIAKARALTVHVPQSAVAAGQTDQYVAMASVLRLAADINNNWAALKGGNRNVFGIIAVLGNLAPDVMAAANNAQNLPSELESLDEDALQTLLNDFGSQMQVSSDRARAILDASLNVAVQLQGVAGSVRTLVGAIEAKG